MPRVRVLFGGHEPNALLRGVCWFRFWHTLPHAQAAMDPLFRRRASQQEVQEDAAADRLLLGDGEALPEGGTLEYGTPEPRSFGPSGHGGDSVSDRQQSRSRHEKNESKAVDAGTSSELALVRVDEPRASAAEVEPQPSIVERRHEDVSQVARSIDFLGSLMSSLVERMERQSRNGSLAGMSMTDPRAERSMSAGGDMSDTAHPGTFRCLSWDGCCHSRMENYDLLDQRRREAVCEDAVEAFGVGCQDYGRHLQR